MDINQGDLKMHIIPAIVENGLYGDWDINTSIIPSTPIHPEEKIRESFGAFTVEEIEAINRLNFSKYSTIFDNLYENKVVYHHRFTAICTIDWLTITPEQFSADVRKHIIIRNEDYDLSPCWNKVPDHWSFGSSWWVLGKRGENKFAGYDYLLWTDANLVRDIEAMISANEVEMAQKILRKLVS